MTCDEWMTAWCDALGVDAPSAAERDALLELAGVAAHAAERMAAPLTCWAAARAGLSPDAALAVARELAETAGT
jgi:hypothetical protein